MKQNSIESIIFYFPYRSVGGVSVLFLAFSKLLADKYDVYIVDFKEGYMGQRVPDGVTFLDIEDVVRYPSNAIVVFQSFAFWRLRDIEKFDSNTKYFYWNLHPRNLEPLDIEFKSERKNLFYKMTISCLKYLQQFNRSKIARCVKYFSEKRALFFMDQENFLTTQAFFPELKLEENYLPCFLLPAKQIKQAGSSRSFYNICWIGRIVDFKVHILNHILTRLSSMKEDRFDFKFTIIGAGDEEGALKKYIEESKPAFEVEILNDLVYESLGDYLVEKCDVLFAMGLSALEGASRRIPTFLVDYAYEPIGFLYQFKFIFEHVKFNLGSEIKVEHAESVSSLESMLLRIHNDYNGIADRCYAYWQENHSGEKTLSIFEDSLKFNETSKSGILRRGLHFPDLFSLLYFPLIRIRNGIGNNKPLHGFRLPSSN